MSNRAVAQEFDLCYPTAHALLDDLSKEGYLERREKGGTYIPGTPLHYDLVHLLFHPSAKDPNHIGHLMLQRIIQTLQEKAIPWKLTWTTRWADYSKNHYLVIHDPFGKIARGIGVSRHGGLILGQPPPSVLAAGRLDSVTFDWFAMGLAAGELLRKQSTCRHVAVLANPYGRHLWAERGTAGFRIIWPRARIIRPASWSPAALADAFKKLFDHANDGVFCCFQGLAILLTRYCKETGLNVPTLVVAGRRAKESGFEGLYLRFFPEEMALAAVRIARNRFCGDAAMPVHITLPPELPNVASRSSIV